MRRKPHVVVVGAGAFGGWTALHLLESGARVTLLDAWGPGNSRASSGGETRIMRGAYGADQPYTQMAARAMQLWTKHERRWKRRFLHRTGVLWMASGKDDSFERGSLPVLRKAKIKYQELSIAQMKKRWPQINFEGVAWGLFEPECGYLEARASCQAVVDAFVDQGGKFQQAAVTKQGLEDSSLRSLTLADGSALKADIYVFACGPWLGKLFPQSVGSFVTATKQDVFFFGAPPGGARFSDGQMPVWGDNGDPFRYGIPGSDRRGFKIADDTRGPEFDPDCGERMVSPETLKNVREYIAFRFPALRNAPLLETRVCQYEQTPDAHFIVDRHPANERIWIVGGGSGHGFKHGAALGEMLAKLILKHGEPGRFWSLARFRNA
ncbi:MAG TPA: FAD-dependent oxidoreductase [Candidatus Sulfotelmatobacter sp.]